MDLDDLFSEPAPASARAGGKFKPKARPRPKKQASVSTASGLHVDAKENLPVQSSDVKGGAPVALDREVACDGCDALPSETFAPSSSTINQSTFGASSEEKVDMFSGGIHSSMQATTCQTWTNVDLDKNICDHIEVTTFPDDSGTQDSVIFRDLAASGMDEGIHIQNERTQTEETEDYFDMETLDIIEEGTTAYCQDTRKFELKPKLQDDVQTEGGNQHANEASDSHYLADDIDYFPMDTNTSEFLVSGEPRIEASNLDTNFYGDVQQELSIPEMPGELGSEMERGNASGGWEHEEQVEHPSNYTAVGEDNCWGNTVNGHPEGVNSLGKSMRASFEENGPALKRKNTNEAPDQSCRKPQKKFRHSTRRRRRTLDKELLETPDEEIRFLPIREMLRLFDYKEWLEKKEAKEAGVTRTQESTRKASNNRDSQNDKVTFDSEESTENQENIRVQSADFLLNYHTYMKRERRVRWSKHDTELFYEGIRQFGSDLSMIQQLFPDKYRAQIKLKYKFEERQHPLKLNDALANRTKHHYHFQNVIKKLQEAAAQKANEKEEEEAATSLAGAMPSKEAETTDFPTKDAAEKSEATDRAGPIDGDKGLHGEEPESGDGSDDGDDEVDGNFWSSYQSEI